jgi:UDP-N-acetyl-2-amino-2-deoxyglucuronate dehydrogenase
MVNFAIIGVGGYVAPRHLSAIRETGNRLVAACDPHDSVGVLDQYFPEASFFTEIERFDRFLEKQRRERPEERAEYVSICTPNYLHDAHVRLALRLHANAICEKPLVIKPWNLDALRELENETGCRVYTILQLRSHPALVALKERLDKEKGRKRHEVALRYVTSRGKWYYYSWKGDEDKSGGVMMNIGVHFFDALVWLFGKAKGLELKEYGESKASGTLVLDRACVSWFLSTDAADLPEESRRNKKPAFRSLTMDGAEIEFSEGFTDLHTRVYEKTLAGQGYGIEDARPSIQLVHDLRELSRLRK